MAELQRQKNDAFRMKLRKEVDAKTFREVTAEIDAAHDQLAREHGRLASEAAMPELPDPSLAWEDLSTEDRRALTEILVDKIIVAPHPHKIVDRKRHYLIRAIPYQDPQQRLSGWGKCTRLGSRSSPGSDRVGNYPRLCCKRDGCAEDLGPRPKDLGPRPSLFLDALLLNE
jgi:hypothetical protein